MKIKYLLNGELRELGELKSVATNSSSTKIEFITANEEYGTLYITGSDFKDLVQKS